MFSAFNGSALWSCQVHRHRRSSQTLTYPYSAYFGIPVRDARASAVHRERAKLEVHGEGPRALPRSISHGARSPLDAHNPRPFQPALGSSMRPSNPLAKSQAGRARSGGSSGRLSGSPRTPRSLLAPHGVPERSNAPSAARWCPPCGSWPPATPTACDSSSVTSRSRACIRMRCSLTRPPGALSGRTPTCSSSAPRWTPPPRSSTRPTSSWKVRSSSSASTVDAPGGDQRRLGGGQPLVGNVPLAVFQRVIERELGQSATTK